MARVWLRNPDAAADEVYILGNVIEDVDVAPGDVVVKLANKKEHTLHKEDIFTANPEGFSCPDNTMLIHLSEATLLANLRSRYQSKDIYTLTGSILLVSAHHDTRRYCLALPSTRTSLTRASLAPRIRAAAPTRMLCVEKIVCRRR